MSYQTEEIFADERINAMCDYILSIVLEAFPPIGDDTDNLVVKKDFVLTGKAAEILQGASDEDVKNVTFITGSQEIYKWCVSNLTTKLRCPGMAFQKQFQFYPNGYYFELWLSSGDPILFETYGTIYIQNTTQIPTSIL